MIEKAKEFNEKDKEDIYKRIKDIGLADDVIKGERVKIQGYLEDFALSKNEADELIMSARKIIYKD